MGVAITTGEIASGFATTVGDTTMHGSDAPD